MSKVVYSLVTICMFWQWQNQQVRMYYGSGTGGRCCIGARQMLRVHSPDGSTFLHEVTSRPPS